MSKPKNRFLFLNCFFSIFTDKSMYRGCASDLNSLSATCSDNPSNCTMCSEDGCNNEEQSKAPSLSCIQCNHDVECPWGHNVTASKPCKNTVYFPMRESCFILTSSDGKAVQRGCTLDLPNESVCNSNRCEKCESSGCNRKNIFEQSCLQCNGQLTEHCAKLNNTVEFTEKCSVSVYPYEKRGCFRKIKGKVGSLCFCFKSCF